MSENLGFTVRVIGRLQHMVLGDPFADALHDYLKQAGRIAWDDDRALFYVEHPTEGWQVAVWLMPQAMQFEPK